VRAVNLLPRDTSRKSALPSTPVLVGVCCGVLVVALLGGDYLLKSADVAKAQRNLDSLTAQVAALPPTPAGPSPAQTQLASENNARVLALTSAMSSRVSWDRVLREFSLVLPNDVWLTSMTARSPVSPSALVPADTSGSAPPAFEIDGHTYSNDGVARLLSRLQVIPDFTNVTLLSSSAANVGGQSIVEFHITANLRSSGGSQ
jgi:Tfp pilus assembly protein PilN